LQIFSNSVHAGLQFYKNREVVGLRDSDATINFTKQIDDLFDALNRNRSFEGINTKSPDLNENNEKNYSFTIKGFLQVIKKNIK
jgi:hypothetical protein